MWFFPSFFPTNTLYAFIFCTYFQSVLYCIVALGDCVSAHSSSLLFAVLYLGWLIKCLPNFRWLFIQWVSWVKNAISIWDIISTIMLLYSYIYHQVWHNDCTYVAWCSQFPPALAMHKWVRFNTLCLAFHMLLWLFCMRKEFPWCAVRVYHVPALSFTYVHK